MSIEVTGSTTISAGMPSTIASRTMSISLCRSVDGSTTNSASTVSVTGRDGLIDTSSYCLANSSATAHGRRGRPASKSSPPSTRASVSITPMRFRVVCATTRMALTISYSVDNPRFRNDVTCSAAPDETATSRKMPSVASDPVIPAGARGVMPNRSRAYRAVSEYGSASEMSTSTFVPAMASISSSTLRRFARACAYGPDTSGLMNA